MKIACIGNMNNMIFPICRYLNSSGYKSVLFLLEEYEHFLPEADTDKVEIEIVKLGWNEAMFGQVSPEQICCTFKEFDFFIGTDCSASYLSKARISLDIYMPAGSDLFQYPFKKFNHFFPEVWEINKYKCARNQFWGIKQATYLSLDTTNDLIEECISKIQPIGKRIQVLPFLYVENGQYNKVVIPDNLKSFAKEISKADFVTIQHCRQAWDYNVSNPHYKANDLLIRGFAYFSKDNPNALLVLLEYGEHVENSKALINDLQIAHQVLWLPKMQRKHLMQFVKMANIGVGELGHSWLSYGAVYETLVCDVAFMGFRKDELYKEQYSELYPMINVKSSVEISDKLEYYYNNQEGLAAMGKKGHTWLLKYAIHPSVAKVLKIVENHQGRSKLPIDWKLVFIQPYFWFIKIFNFFKIRFMRS